MAAHAEPPEDPFDPLRRSIQILDQLTRGLERRPSIGDRLALAAGLALAVGFLTAAILAARPSGERLDTRVDVSALTTSWRSSQPLSTSSPPVQPTTTSSPAAAPVTVPLVDPKTATFTG